jgi:hypothetical protein
MSFRCGLDLGSVACLQLRSACPLSCRREGTWVLSQTSYGASVTFANSAMMLWRWWSSVWQIASASSNGSSCTRFKGGLPLGVMWWFGHMLFRISGSPKNEVSQHQGSQGFQCPESLLSKWRSVRVSSNGTLLAFVLVTLLLGFVLMALC